MQSASSRIAGIKKHPFAAVVGVVSAAIVVLIAACADIPEQVVAPEVQPVAPGKNEALLGTWVSEQWPQQKFVFTGDEVRYRELKYSVVLEGSGTYTYTPDGIVEWEITWYSGDFTQWKGHLEGDRITVEFQNSWEDTHGTDTLTRVR